MNQDDTKRIIAILAGAGGRANLTDMTVPVWTDALADLPYDLVQEAAREWTREHRHWPYPVEIRELVAKRALGTRLTAERAWQDVTQSLRAGLNSTILDTTTRVAVRACGGWGAFVNADDLTWLRKDFLTAYKAALTDTISPNALMPAIEDRQRALEAGRQTFGLKPGAGNVRAAAERIVEQAKPAITAAKGATNG